jgi:hypothetical protein
MGTAEKRKGDQKPFLSAESKARQKDQTER